MKLPEVLFARNLGGGSGGKGKTIANFNFKSSLTDSVNGFVATISGATRDSSGLHFSSSSNICNLPVELLSICRTYEIKMGLTSVATSSNGTLLSFGTYDNTSSHGLIYHYSSGKWGVWDHNNGWEDSDISDPDFFSGSVVKIEILPSNKWNIYKDDELVFSPNKIFSKVPNSFAIGGVGSNSYYNMTIESLVIRG